METSNTNETSAPFGLLLCDDLMFTSRITGTARDLGLVIKSARSPAQAEALAQKQQPPCVILDLANPDLVIADLIAKLRSGGKPLIVAYGSHMDTATLQAARAAGCDLVLPRSKFVADLPTALPRWFSGSV